MDDELINEDYLNETIIEFDGVYVRNKELNEIRNKFELLCRSVAYLTGWGLKSQLLTFTGDTFKYPTCICSCNKCGNVYTIKDNASGILFGVGSSCIKQFGNKKLEVEAYYHTKAKRCLECKNPLVCKSNPYLSVNCNKGNKICIDCNSQKIYLNVPYEEKDYAKYRGALWDNQIRKWYIYRDNKNYHHLIRTYPNTNLEKK